MTVGSLLSALYPGKDVRKVVAENAALLGYPDLVYPARAASLNINVPPQDVVLAGGVPRIEGVPAGPVAPCRVADQAALDTARRRLKEIEG